MPEKPHGMKGVMDHWSFLKRLKIVVIFNRHVKQKFDWNLLICFLHHQEIRF